MSFKTITRYPDYEINEEGIIKRKKSGKCRSYSLVNGHPKIVIKGQTEYISRLVAEEFIGTPSEKTDIVHLDGNKANNSKDNLIWATHSEAQLYSYGGLGINAPGGAMPSKKILVIETGKEYESIHACAIAISGSPVGIRNYLNGKVKSYKGYTFRLL